MNLEVGADQDRSRPPRSNLSNSKPRIHLSTTANPLLSSVQVRPSARTLSFGITVTYLAISPFCLPPESERTGWEETDGVPECFRRHGAGRARGEPIAAHRPANSAFAEREAAKAPRQQTRSVGTFSLRDLLETAG